MSGRALDGVAVIRGKLSDDLQQGGAVVFHWLSVAAQPRLELGTQRRHTCLELGQAVANVVHEQTAQRACQVA